MTSLMDPFVFRLYHLSNKDDSLDMLLRNMNIARLMTYVQHVNEEKVRDRKAFRN